MDALLELLEKYSCHLNRGGKSTITERGVALSTSTATAYKYNVVGHLSFGAPKCEKAQKSSGFWANRTYGFCIKDNVLIE